MVLTITIFIVDQTTRYHFSYNIVDQTTIAIISYNHYIYCRSNDNRYQCNIETISNSRDYYSRFNQLELQNIKSN